MAAIFKIEVQSHCLLAHMPLIVVKKSRAFVSKFFQLIVSSSVFLHCRRAFGNMAKPYIFVLSVVMLGPAAAVDVGHNAVKRSAAASPSFDDLQDAFVLLLQRQFPQTRSMMHAGPGTSNQCRSCRKHLQVAGHLDSLMWLVPHYLT